MSDATYTQDKGNGPLGSHPMRQQVIDAIIKGEPATSIKKWVKPTVSHVSISKLARAVKHQVHVATVLKQAETIAKVTELTTVNTSDVPRLSRDAVMGQQHLARLEEIYVPLARQVQLADAENDRQGMATVAKAAISAIRTQMEADGTLAQVGQASGSNNTFNIIVLPSSCEEEHEVIDVPVERV